MNRIRKVSSIRRELLQKSKEAALAAVGIFNNPNIQFKAETYIVLMIIAWTYLLHAYFRLNIGTMKLEGMGEGSFIEPNTEHINIGNLNVV